MFPFGFWLFVFETDNNLLPEGNLPPPAAFNVYQS